MESQLVQFSNELAALAGRVSPTVVAVEAGRRMFSSGVHWRKDLIVTADHTIRREEDITIVQPDGKSMPVSLVGRDPGRDIALLRGAGINAPVVDPDPLPDLRPGELALVLGRSPRSGPNVSMGIISAVSGPWRTWRGRELDRYIRLDATVFSGTSGGLVVNHDGRTIGIATSILSRVSGLAIPRTSIDTTVDMLLQHGSTKQGYIGVSVQHVPLPPAFQKTFSSLETGVLMVLAVEQSAPASHGGILAGDIMLEFNGKPLNSVEELQSLLNETVIGKPVNFKIIRGGELKELQVVVGERNNREES